MGHERRRTLTIAVRGVNSVGGSSGVPTRCVTGHHAAHIACYLSGYEQVVAARTASFRRV